MGVHVVFALSQWLRQNTNPPLFLGALAFLELSNVGIILLTRELQQVASSRAPTLDVRTLDVRNEGYNVQDVENLLRGYGREGRKLYSDLELLDLMVFMWSYAAVFSMLLSAGTSIAPESLQLVNLLPWTAAMADAMENIIILTMLYRYPHLTTPLAPCAVAASRLKWLLLFASAIAIAGVGLYRVGWWCLQTFF